MRRCNAIHLGAICVSHHLGKQVLEIIRVPGLSLNLGLCKHFDGSFTDNNAEGCSRQQSSILPWQELDHLMGKLDHPVAASSSMLCGSNPART